MKQPQRALTRKHCATWGSMPAAKANQGSGARKGARYAVTAWRPAGSMKDMSDSLSLEND
jgi:hypothetical protein